MRSLLVSGTILVLGTSLAGCKGGDEASTAQPTVSVSAPTSSAPKMSGKKGMTDADITMPPNGGGGGQFGAKGGG